MLALPFIGSLALHTAILFGAQFSTVDAPVPSSNSASNPTSCPPGQRLFDKTDGSGGTYCGVLVRGHLVAGDSSEVLPQPPAPAELPATTPPAYNASHYSNTTGAVQGASAATAAALLETINIRLTDTAYSSYPWYGKIQAVKLLKTDGSESNGSESSLYIQYKVTSDFKLGNCYKYTANALISWVGASKGDPSYAPAYNSNCYQFSNYEQVDKSDGLLNSNAYYVTKTQQLPHAAAQQLPVCSSGYTYDYSKSACSLTTPSAAPPGPDGVCDVVRTSPTTFARSNPFDPDCASVINSGDLAISADASTVTLKGTPGPQSPTAATATIKANAGGSSTLDVTTVNKVSGETQSTTRTLDEQAKVTTETFKPATYGGTPVNPVMTYPAAGTACGAPGQPTCKVEIVGGNGGSDGQSLDPDAIGKALADNLKSDPVDKLGDGLPSSVTDKVTGLSARAIIPVSSVCPSDPFSITLPFPAPIGDYQLSDGGAFCGAMSQYQDLIRALSIAFGWIAATFIVLRA